MDNFDTKKKEESLKSFTCLVVNERSELYFRVSADYSPFIDGPNSKEKRRKS